MSNKNHAGIKTMLFAAGLVAGSVAITWWQTRFERRGESILQDVKQFFQEQGEIEGSWIELEPVELERDYKLIKVFYGGITLKEHEQRTQFEFVADAKTGALLDVYPL